MPARDVRLLSVAGLVSLLAMIGFMEIRAVWDGRYTCPSIARAGKSCAACGGTGAWRNAMRCDFPQAFREHPPGALAGLATWGFILGAAFSTVVGRAGYAVAGLAFAGSLLLAAMACQAWIVWFEFSAR